MYINTRYLCVHNNINNSTYVSVGLNPITTRVKHVFHYFLLRLLSGPRVCIVIIIMCVQKANKTRLDTVATFTIITVNVTTVAESSGRATARNFVITVISVKIREDQR